MSELELGSIDFEVEGEEDYVPIEAKDIQDIEVRIWVQNILAGITSQEKLATPATQFEDYSDEDRFEMLCMRIPTSFEEIVLSIPYPKGYFPKYGLPYWKTQPLNTKILIPPHPKNTVLLSRGKIGSKLWKRQKKAEFINYDPHNIEVPQYYENLHDEYLKEYFQNDPKLKQLVQQEDVNEDQWVMCNSKQFNDLRKYMNRCHMFQVKQKLEEMRTEQKEKYEVQNIKDFTYKKIEKILETSALEELRKKKKEEAKIAEEEYKWQIQQNIKERELRYEKVMLDREVMKAVLQKRGEEWKEGVRIKNLIKWEVARIRRRNVVRTMVEKEKKSKIILRKIKEEKENAKKEELKRQWYCKLKYNEARVKKENHLIDSNKNIFHQNVEIRNQLAVENQRNAENINEKVLEKARHKKAQLKLEEKYKALYKTIKKQWFKVNKNADLKVEEFRVKKCYKAALFESRNTPGAGPDQYSILLRTRDRLERESEIPEQVSYVLEVVIERGIIQYCENKMSLIFTELILKATEHGERKIEEYRINKIYKSVRVEKCAKKKKTGVVEYGEEQEEEELVLPYEVDINPVVEGPEYKDKSQQKVPASYQRFGFDIASNTYYEPITTLNKEPKPVKTRTPTPFPSMENLVRESLIEPELEDIIPEDAVGETLKERKKLWKTFRYLAKQLLVTANEELDVVIEPRTRVFGIQKLAKLRGYTREDVLENLGELIANYEMKDWSSNIKFKISASMLAKDVVNNLFHPAQFQKPVSEELNRRKVMWCKSKLLETTQEY